MTTLQLEQLDYQRRAIDAMVHAFEGQTRNTFDNSYFAEVQTNVSDRSPRQFDADLLLEEVLPKQGFGFARTVERLEAEFPKNAVYQVRDEDRTALVCLDAQLDTETVDALQKRKADQRSVCLELALDTTRKWTLTRHLGKLLTSL